MLVCPTNNDKQLPRPSCLGRSLWGEQVKSYLDLSRWHRRAHFEFYRRFDEPFFGFCVDIDCGNAFSQCKSAGESFYLFYLHKIAQVANELESFRYRLEDDRVAVYDHVAIGSTVAREDGSFGFSYLPFHPDFEQFCRDAEREFARVRSRSDLEPSNGSDNVIHFSAVPWVKFSALSHARHFSHTDSCPKISVGKLSSVPAFADDGSVVAKQVMPVSVHGHHALMDGADIAHFMQRLEQLLTEG